MRTRILAVAALAAASFVAVPIATAGTPPSVTSIIEGVDTVSGEGTLFVTGAKLNKFKTFSLKTGPGGDPAGTPTLLVKGRTQIALLLPPGMAAGEYELALEPKSGEPVLVTFSYRTDRSTFQEPVRSEQNMIVEGGLDVIGHSMLSGVDVNGGFRADSGIGAFTTFNFPPSGGDQLMAEFSPTAAATGAQVRFSQSGGFPFIDIGQNAAGDYEIENQADMAVLTVTQTGNIQVSGNGFKPGGGSWAVLSDGRAKQDVVAVTSGLERLMKLRSVEYAYKDPASSKQLPGRHVGFIAQEVEQIFPQWVGEDTDGMKYLAIKGFESLTVAALRELRAEKDAEIEALRDENVALRARLDAIEAALTALPGAKTTAEDEGVSAPR